MAKQSQQIPFLTHLHPTRGFLFLGDPHAWSRTPGRRLDDYCQTVLNKIAASIELANKLNLWPVCLGDLFHEATDNNLAMLSQLIEILKRSDRTFLCAVGNHDLTERELTRGTALELLETAGALKTIRFNEPFALIDMLDEKDQVVRVLLGATPYGNNIPVSLAAWTGKVKALDHEATKEALGVQATVWITHEDLAFDHRYPGAVDIHPITGVDTVVNGHMHLSQTPVRQGKTTWYNPGNISRLTIDLSKQTPRVWRWTPNETRNMIASDGLEVPLLDGIALVHERAETVLSQKGRATLNAQKEGHSSEPMEPDAAIDEPKTGIASSVFVEKLKEDQGDRRTDDGVILSQTIQEVMEQKNTPEHIAKIVERLLEGALDEHRKQTQ